MRPLLRLLLAATVSVAACGGSSSGDGTAPITTGVAGSSSTTTTVPGSTIAPEASGLAGLSAELATLRIENRGRHDGDDGGVRSLGRLHARTATGSGSASRLHQRPDLPRPARSGRRGRVA